MALGGERVGGRVIGPTGLVGPARGGLGRDALQAGKATRAPMCACARVGPAGLLGLGLV